MKSLFDPADAERCRQRYSTWGNDLADRVYTSRLLGREPALVLHGGGNTSVKSRGQEVGGEPVDVMWVKGSGWDLGSIEPEGFAQCRLGPLRGHCQLERLSDEAMVTGLRSQMLNPSGPTPSVEALLHAHLPGKFVDHTHADAVLAIVDQPDAADRVRELWGERAAFLPYVAPGFLLARRILDLHLTESSPPLVILERHGLFTWGRTAQESYERMIAAVSAAEQYVQARRSPSHGRVPAAPTATPEQRQRRRALLSPVLRGALLGRAGGQRFVLDWRDTEPVLDFLARESAPNVAGRGCITPDHAIRTKPYPAWLIGMDAAVELGADELRARVTEALDAFATSYAQYFDAHAAGRRERLTRLDSLPRIVAVPGLGFAGLGRTHAQAKVAADLFEHAVSVMADAEAIGSYRPVTHAELFDVEYWSLEQAKLGARRAEPAFESQVVLVTGGASGIGLATASHFAALGAHVLLVDRDADALQGTETRLRERFGSRVNARVADLTAVAQARAAVDAAVLAFGGLDVVVSNAGSAPSGALHAPDGAALLSGSLELNLLSHQHVAQAAAEVFIRQGTGGCLLFNASKSAFNPGPMFGPYAVAKAALVALMKQYAIDLGPYGVRANAVNADRVRTRLFSEELIESRARARGLHPDEYFKGNLLKRETLAEDVARAFAYLAGAAATTGAVLPVDGGNPAAFPR